MFTRMKTNKKEVSEEEMEIKAKKAYEKYIDDNEAQLLAIKSEIIEKVEDKIDKRKRGPK